MFSRLRFLLTVAAAVLFVLAAASLQQTALAASWSWIENSKIGMMFPLRTKLEGCRRKCTGRSAVSCVDRCMAPLKPR